MGRRDDREAQRRDLGDRVLAKERRLDPADDSPAARQVRAAAQQVRDHRSSPR